MTSKGSAGKGKADKPATGGDEPTDSQSGQFDEVSLQGARKEVDPEVYHAIQIAVEDYGFRLRRQGHKFALYCPCDEADRGWMSVNGTPRNPSNHARHIRRAIGHCPAKHQLMR